VNELRQIDPFVGESRNLRALTTRTLVVDQKRSGVRLDVASVEAWRTARQRARPLDIPNSRA
jgi:hypothetical protein